MADDFTLDDFRKESERLARMDAETIRRMPGVAEMIPEDEEPKVALRRIAKMIDAMTPEERRDPDRIDEAARVRIATASGTDQQEVERFLVSFGRLRETMREMARMSLWQRIKLVLGLGKPPKPDGA